MAKKKVKSSPSAGELIGSLRAKKMSWDDITYEVNNQLGLGYTKGTIIAIAHRDGLVTSPQKEARYERYALPHNPAGFKDELEEMYLRLTSYKEMANLVAVATKEEWVDVFAVGDIHLGHRLCDFARVKKYLDYIEQADNTYCFLMGDLMECAQRNSVGRGQDEELINADQQYDVICRLLKPLAKKGKILWAHIGNHEGRIPKNASFDVMQKLFDDILEVPYLDFEGFTIVRVNDVEYTFYTHHGWGSARTKAGKIKKLDEMTYWNEADIYGMGHTHELFQGFANQRYVNPETLEVGMRKRPIMLTGSFLKYGGYISAHAFPPSSLGCSKVELNSKRKKTFIRE